MRKNYRLTFDDRCAIANYLDMGKNYSEIARLLNLKNTTVRNEIVNRSENGVYNAVQAQKHYDESMQFNRGKFLKVDEDMIDYIEKKLALKWSPRQIAAKMPDDIGKYLSFATIYRLIRENKVEYKKTDLRFKGSNYNKSSETRGKIQVGERAIMYRPINNK
ncbi:helix-turn-helix domain-containing protein [Macrococcus capreoli]|uniref:helix-turn-helix domain-containing protein n=1 Tax=Macrococcus capreoli TaxID=2982690 RepID=UPI0021D5EB47|nr:helix-turn-helix domain-containing protein [Macrococcus sp. TMW 2.2395]MCU7557645.1 helix-turn-helix domain-containing protein [Macrococcus sp. TMW 2.2395]